MADRFSDIVSCLGGPAVTPSDIEWVVDLPAGKQLVDWIVAQVEGAPESDEAISQLSNEQGLKACLSDIALETEELETLRKAQQLNLAVQDSDQWLLSKYLSPSRLRSRQLYMDSETAILQAEAKDLRHRLQTMKSACNTAKQTLKDLSHEIKEADTSIHNGQERLSELSINVCAIESHVLISSA